MVVVVGVILLPIPLLNSDSFIKNANISPLHSIVVFNVYPLAKRTSISFSIFLRLVPSFTLGSALLTIINGLSCQFVTFHLALASLSTVGITWLVIPPLLISNVSVLEPLYCLSGIGSPLGVLFIEVISSTVTPRKSPPRSLLPFYINCINVNLITLDLV